MLDPLDDPRATDLLAALPDDVSTLSANFRAAAGESETTAAGLSAAQNDGTWTGRAADAFRRAIGRLPHELSRVRAGYSAVADALAAYEPELSRLQAGFVQVIAELSDAQTRLGPARASAQAARASFTGTTPSRHLAPRVLAQAELAIARADGAVGGYDREIVRLTSRAFALLDEFADVRSACRDSIATAQRTAPVRPRSGQGTTVIGASVSRTSTAAGQRINAMIRQADALLGTPYVHGGGHSGWETNGGLDCSGFVSAILRSGGYLSAPQTTEGFAGQAGLDGGPGRFVTIYDRTGCGPNEHVIINLNGRFYESGGGSASGGAPFVHQFSPSETYLASFNKILHPVGL
jgi:cell wall-associated NlpC family hydrolase